MLQKNVEVFDRIINAIESIKLLADILELVNNFSTRNIVRVIKHVKVGLVITALSGGPVDLTIRL